MNTPRQAYAEKLKDPRWQKKRLEIFERDQWRCQCCGDANTTLVVHHHFYLPQAEPWEYPNEALVTFCDPCHQEEPQVRKFPEERLINNLRMRRFWAEEVGCLADALYGFKGNAHEFALLMKWLTQHPEQLAALTTEMWQQMQGEDQ